MRFARLDDSSGSSQGWWAVRDLPGVLIWKDGEGWRINCSPLLFKGLERDRAERIWGEGWEEKIDQLLPRIDDLPHAAFPSRSAAMQALEAHLAELPPALGETLIE